MSRAATLAAAARAQVDVVVVGGGIVGTGIARDLARRGARVVLVERQDLASGTSSRPTRLIHGGLRYLEMFDFGLVRTDMREREILLRTAPHLVQPRRFLMPLYGRSPWYRARLHAGMLLYDALSFDKSLPTRQWVDANAVRQLEPGLATHQLQGAWQFYDGQVPLVERLVVENALDAAAHGALIINYAAAVRFQRDTSGAVCGVVLSDRLTGDEIEVRARLTINASGPWVDLTTGGLRPRERPLLRLTKGVHLVVPSMSREAHVLFARRDGRLFFVIPWLGQSLVGTTDTDFDGDPADVVATAEDVEYLAAEARHAFPDAPLEEIHYTWAGVRALARVDDVAAGKVSRKHAIYDHAKSGGIAGLVTVVGGKITGYRAIAAEVATLAAGRLGLTGTQSDTDAVPLPGGHLRDVGRYVDIEVAPRARALGLDDTQAQHLGAVYGSLVPSVLERVAGARSLGQRLCPHHPTILAQVARARDDEWAQTLSDVMLRRTTLGLTACQADGCLDRIAEGVAQIFDWSPAERARQLAAYRTELEPMRRFSRAPQTA
jgi:glycerol-3-phosphate dehydrogenase